MLSLSIFNPKTQYYFLLSPFTYTHEWVSNLFCRSLLFRSLRRRKSTLPKSHSLIKSDPTTTLSCPTRKESTVPIHYRLDPKLVGHCINTYLMQLDHDCMVYNVTTSYYLDQDLFQVKERLMPIFHVFGEGLLTLLL